MSMYFDVASTVKPKQEVIDAMIPYFKEKWHNPSALYSASNKVKTDIEKARKTVGDFINADKNEIFFTSGGSESNSWAIQGFVNRCNRMGRNAAIITSTIEHKSIMDCVDNMNVDVHYVDVDEKGFVDMFALESLLQYVNTEVHEILVSIQLANNEIGTIQHIKEIASMVHEYNAVLHTDAVQAFGQIPIDIKELNVDMLSASGHKIGTPKGIGILFVKDSIKIDPLIYGSQMDGMRGGTENVPYIMGMAKAVKMLDFEKNNKVRKISNYLIDNLILMKCSLNGAEINRLPNNINVTINEDISAESLVYLMDFCGIQIGVGSACNSNAIRHSYVLKAIGLSNESIEKTIRITIPDDVEIDDINKFIYELKSQIKLLTKE